MKSCSLTRLLNLLACAVLLAAPASAGVYSDAVNADPGLISYWRLGDVISPPDATAADATGAYDGAYVGNVVRGLPGAIAGSSDTAADFAGGRVDIPANAAFDSGGAALTVSAWVQPDGAGAFRWIVGKDNDNANLDYLLGMNADGRFRFITQGLSNDVAAIDPSVFDGSAWHHVVGVQDPSAGGFGQVSLYVNGAAVNSVAMTTFGVTATNGLRIGARGADAGQAVDGRIDDVAVFNRALSAAEVQAQYDAGLNPAGNYASLIQGDAGLVAYYQLGEAAVVSPVAVDETNLNPGAYIGVVTSGAPGALFGDANSSVDFSGGRMNVPPSPSLDSGGGALTVEAWVQADGSGSFQWIVSKDSDNTNLDYLLGINPDGAFRFITQGLGNDVSALAPSTHDGTAWHHVVGVQDPATNTVALYVDGVFANSVPLSVTGILSASGVAVADRTGFGGGQIVNGRIDEVALYARALSADEIALHFQLGTTGVPEPSAWALAVVSLGLLGVVRRRSRR